MYLAQSNMENPFPLIAIIFAFNGIEANKFFLLFCFTIIYMYLPNHIWHACLYKLPSEFTLYNEKLIY